VCVCFERETIRKGKNSQQNSDRELKKKLTGLEIMISIFYFLTFSLSFLHSTRIFCSILHSFFLASFREKKRPRIVCGLQHLLHALFITHALNMKQNLVSASLILRLDLIANETKKNDLALSLFFLGIGKKILN